RFLNGTHPHALAPDAKLVLLNAEPRDLGEPRIAHLTLLCDAAAGLEALDGLLEGSSPRPSRKAELDALRAWAEDLLAQIQPQYGWVRALRNALPEDGILISEFTQVG